MGSARTSTSDVQSVRGWTCTNSSRGAAGCVWGEMAGDGGHGLRDIAMKSLYVCSMEGGLR